MAEKNNATCSVCGNGYHVCYSCKDSIQLNPWKIRCCSVSCYKTSQVVRGFSTGVYTKDEFRSKLKNLDLSNLENYREHIKTLIKDVLNDEPIAEVEIETEAVETEKPIEAVVTMEEVIAKNPIYSRKKNYKIEVE